AHPCPPRARRSGRAVRGDGINVSMRRVGACAAMAVWISVTLLMSACTSEVAAPPVITAPPPPPPPQRPEPSTRRQVRAEIVRWFSAAGYPGFQVEALVEHARMESGFRPCAAGPAGLRYSFQWGGLRLRRLHEFDGAERCPPLDTQLAFADNELRNEPNYGCFWRATTKSAALSALRRGFGRGRC
ncbi:MAG: hypothetical protein WA459_06885, partial [Stellaceae bacterium]